jgi:CMP-N-acetylneuraminic acid synthetase
VFGLQIQVNCCRQINTVQQNKFNSLQFQFVIPARGGSKRLKGKNLLPLNGKPLIAYSIETGMKFAGHGEVFVNTDDPEIARFASKLGARVVHRPAELATDLSTTVDVLRFQLEWFKKEQIACDAIVLLQPTNPFRKAALVSDCLSKFQSANRASLATFSPLIKKLGNISKSEFTPSNYVPGQRSQDLNPLYYENGMLYISKSDAIREGYVITADVLPVITNDIGSQVDIDELEDLWYAEFLISKNII